MPDSKAAKAAAKTDESDLYQKALEVGFFGNSPKSIPNEKFSLQTGPESPSAASQIVDARRDQLTAAEASLTTDEPKKS